MPNLELQGTSYFLDDNETVLDGLLRQNIAVPHGCKAGACQSCVMQVKNGDLAPSTQLGLKDSQKQLGYFLSCLCKPTTDMTIGFVDQHDQKVFAEVLEKEILNEHVLRLKLEPVLTGRAGQYINIWLNDTTIRSFSIANPVELDQYIELHIKIYPGGQFSTFAKNRLSAGETLALQGPIGDCIYSPQNQRQPLLLIGISTGLAPLYGIVREALYRKHQGPIDLVIGARNAKDFYLADQLRALADANMNLTVTWVAQVAEQASHVNQQDLYQWVKARFPSTANYSIYLCGAESFVRKMKKQCFLAGASMADIHSDAFLPCS